MELVRGVRPFLVRLGRLSAALQTAVALVVAGAMTAEAQATLALPIRESFRGNSADIPNAWYPSGTGTATGVSGTWTPRLTGTSGISGYPAGWLQLTTADYNLSGLVYLNGTFSSALGLVITFQYAMYGGIPYPNNASGRYGDGFSFFLINGNQATVTPGGSGGALGYACATGTGPAPGPCTVAGVPGAYMGVGFDQYGGFAGNGVGSNDPALGSDAHPAQISVRGSWGGTTLTGYRYLTTSGPLGDLRTGNNPNTAGNASGTTGVRTVRIIIEHDPSNSHEMLTVQMNTGMYTGGTTPSPVQMVIPPYDMSAATGQMALPATLKLGFAASTGGAYQTHLIRDLTVIAPTELKMEKTAEPAQVNPGQTLTYRLHVSSNYTNAVNNATVTDTIPAGLTGVTWTCTPSLGSAATCSPASGSGNNVSVTASFPNLGDSVDIVITGTVSATAAGSTLTNTATITPPEDRAQVNDADLTSSVDVDVGPAVLTITVPDEATLPSTTPGATTAGSIGPVTVSDYRGVAGQSWTATVSWTEFTGPPPSVIGLDRISYWSGPWTDRTGTGTLTPGQPTAQDAQQLTDTGITAFSLTNGSAANSATWNPALVVRVPYGTVVGDYTATVYHSVT